MNLKHAILNDVLSGKPKKPLYHYTTQTGLLGITRDRQIWATHTQYLNDCREFLHAVDLVRGEIQRLLNEQNTTQPREASAKHTEALNRMHDALSLSPEHINACVCSFSEDSDSLSQWRAYGGSSGFAIGFSGEVLGAAVEKQLDWPHIDLACEDCALVLIPTLPVTRVHSMGRRNTQVEPNLH